VAALDSDDHIVFRVTDTGVGIAPEDQARIFEEFTQVENPLQKNVRGTGLGLPLSRKLAGLLGGRLEMESTPGLGSRFELRLPRIHRNPRITPAAGMSLLVGGESRHG
jgi:signal transduction histidine kinase